MTTNPAPQKHVGISYFREEDWPRWLAMDPDFQPDYERWVARTEGIIKESQAKGVKAELITLDPDLFLAWSRTAGLGVGTAARSAYVTFLMMNKSN